MGRFYSITSFKYFEYFVLSITMIFVKISKLKYGIYAENSPVANHSELSPVSILFCALHWLGFLACCCSRHQHIGEQLSSIPLWAGATTPSPSSCRLGAAKAPSGCSSWCFATFDLVAALALLISLQTPQLL